MAEAEIVVFFRVIDALEDHDVSVDAAVRAPRERSEPHRWAAIDLGQETLRVNTSKGQVDRVVYLSPDVATALRQWHGLQSTTADYVFPSPMPRKGGLPLGARQIRNRMTLSEAGRITKRYAPPRCGIPLPPSSSMPAPRWRWSKHSWGTARSR